MDPRNVMLADRATEGDKIQWELQPFGPFWLGFSPWQYTLDWHGGPRGLGH